MPKITKVEFAKPEIKRLKKVAAYARVSMESEKMMHSLSAQVSYYSSLIQSNPEWEYAGVYADNFISGTSIAKRDEFKRMISDCEAGKIDIILTKSISRFARNTVDLLETVRHLKDLGVEVRFEKENISSFSGDGELMMSILASFAQEESYNISENLKWGIRKRMQDGIPRSHFRILGYRWDGDILVVEPDEAEVVRRIFRSFIDGKSIKEIRRELEADGIRSVNGCTIWDSGINRILTNVTYTGNLLLQKSYTIGTTDKKRKKNQGELPQYFVENTHEPIIDMQTFQMVQDEIKRRKELGVFAYKSLSCFTRKIKCSNCGCNFIHSQRANKHKEFSLYGEFIVTWRCGTKRKGERCTNKDIPEHCLRNACANALGLSDFDEEVFLKRVDYIVAIENQTLEFHFKDGTTSMQNWNSTARADCWTDEYRRRTSGYRRNHAPSKKGVTCFTTKIKCVQCGCNFRRDISKGKSGTTVYWHCHEAKKTCGTKGLQEDALKKISAEVLGIDEFDDAIFLEQIDYISVISATEICFLFKDGREVYRQLMRPKRRSRNDKQDKE
ncbi:MAG: recombinase family protein [Oscillospiraceae bacterium]|nr:recombinase family protein [Oscillospiraceae bacterium]